jgi:hypothetical protein
MNTKDFTTTILVDQTPEEAFDAINNVRAWWIDEIEGNSEKPHDEFAVRFGDIHYSKQKLTEVIPGEKVVWLVTDSRLNFVKDTSEWTDTQIVFEITEGSGKTQVRFTQLGLVPKVECYNACSGAWGYYFGDSLLSLITTGTGKPERKKRLHNSINY